MYCTARKGDKKDPLNNPDTYKEILSKEFLPELVFILKDSDNENSIFKQDELDLLQPIQELVSMLPSEIAKKEETEQ